MKLLQVDSSAREGSTSRRLTARFAEEWKKRHRDGEVVHRDLITTVIPCVTEHWAGTFLEDSAVSPAQRAYLATSDELTAELQSADVIVIGSPMYNYSISAPLKAWIDQIVRLGKTCGYGPEGPMGLLGGKKTFILTSRGAAYNPDSPTVRLDFQEPYLRAILGFIGLTDITFLHAGNQMKAEAEEELTKTFQRIIESANAV